MRISVIMPTYQGEKFIRDTLTSIANQSRLPDQLVISVDECTDDTLYICKRFSSSSEFPVKVVQHRPAGISSNYFNALDHATGDVIIVSDHDDVWDPKRVEYIENVFRSDEEISIISVDSEICDEDLNSMGTTLRGGPKYSKMLHNLVIQDDFAQALIGIRLDAHSLAFLSKVKNPLELIRDVKIRDFWFENKVLFSALSIGKLFLIPDALTFYRQHRTQHIGFYAGKQSYFLDQGHSQIERLIILRMLLQKMKHESLLGPEINEYRIKSLDEFIEFQNIRHPNEISLRSIFSIFNALVDGKYNKYSRRGVLSACKDFVSLANNVVRKILYNG